MSKKYFENERGIIHLAPILVIGALLVLVLTFKGSNMQSQQASVQTEVLSENQGEGGSDQDDEDVKDDEDEDGESEEAAGVGGVTRAASDPEDEEEVEIEDEDSDEVEDEEESEDEDELEEEIEEEIEIEDEEGTRSAKIKIRTQAGRFEVEIEGVEAGSNFPISVNSETNELIITTPNGERVVTILPDQAVENMIENGFLDVSLSVEIQEGETEVEYEIEGVDDQKLLGVFDVKVSKKIKISAEDGDILNIDQSLLSRILDFLSI